MAEPSTDGYPVVLRLGGRRVVVVGGGRVAARKVEGLLSCGADVVVVAPQIDPALASLAGVTVHRRPYAPTDLVGARLVVVATDDGELGQRVHDDAEAARVWVNVADDPARCTAVLPAIARRGAVIVAVSTQGASPALAARLRDRLAAALPDDIEEIAATLSAERAGLHAQGRSTESIDWSQRLDDLLP